MTLAPSMLLVHGVGVGPSAFAPLERRLIAQGLSVVVVHRPGYGRAAERAFRGVDAQVADLVTAVERLRAEGPVAGLVGVSGGATLALLAAVELTVPVPVVAHEPLVGPLAPLLHTRVARAVAELDDGAERFVRHLVGEATWAGLDDADRATVVERPELVAAEARAFAAVTPTAEDLATIGRRLTTTVGARSGPERREAAAVLASLAGAGADVVTVDGAGHLAHVDAPDAFAAVITRNLGQIGPKRAVPAQITEGGRS